MKRCDFCGRAIQDTESHWRDGAGKIICNDCDERSRGKHDHIPTPNEEKK